MPEASAMKKGQMHSSLIKAKLAKTNSAADRLKMVAVLLHSILGGRQAHVAIRWLDYSYRYAA
jgi:hypothetical protein